MIPRASNHQPARRLSWVAALLVAALFCSGSAFVAWRWAQRDSVTLNTAILLPCRPDQRIKPAKDGLVYMDDSLLYALDGRGQPRWTYMIGANAEYALTEEGIACWSGYTLTLLNQTNGAVLFSGALSEPILSAKLGARYAAALVGEEQNGALVVMEPGGRQIDRIVFDQVTVVDYGFFGDGRMLWVMTLDTEGTSPYSTVRTYQPGKAQTGAISDGEQVVYQALFQAAKVMTVGTTHVKTYDYAGVERANERRLVYGWYLSDVRNDGGALSMAFIPMTQADAVTEVSDVRLLVGDTDRTIRMPFPARKLYLGAGKVYGFTKEVVMACELTRGIPQAYEMPVQVTDVLGIAGASAIVVSGGQVYLVPLP